MPSLSSSNRSQLAVKLEGIYPTNFGVPQAGNGTNLNMLSESFDYTIKTEQSKTIRADRQIPDVIQVSASPQGGFAFEMQYGEYDAFLEGVMQSSFSPYGTQGVTAAVATLTLTANTITAGVAPTGNDAFTNLAKGAWFVVMPAGAAPASVDLYFAGRPFRVSRTVAPTATVITLDASTPLDTAQAGTTLANATLGSSVVYNGATMKSYTVEVGHLDVSQFRVYPGMIVSKMDLSLSVGSILTGSFDFMGKSFTPQQVTAMGTPKVSQTFTPANATKGVFDIFEGGSSIGATTFIKSGSFSIDNSLRAQEAVGVFGNAGIAAGTIKISGKLQVYYADNAAIYNKLLNNTRSSLTIPVLDVDGNGYVFHFPSIRYTSAKVATGGLDQDNMLDMDFMATLDPDPTSTTYQKTVAIYRVGALRQ